MYVKSAKQDGRSHISGGVKAGEPPTRVTACGALPCSSRTRVGGYLYLSALRALPTKEDDRVSRRGGA